MIGKLNQYGRDRLGHLVKDPDNVKVWGMLNEIQGKRYCVEAKWDGCTHPKHYQGIDYIHPEIVDSKEKELYGGYWVSGDIFECIVSSYSNNLEAKGILSSEY